MLLNPTLTGFTPEDFAEHTGLGIINYSIAIAMAQILLAHTSFHLDFSVLAKNVLLVVRFIVLRSLGKGLGAVTGATLAGAPGQVRKYVAGGLIPQGGIVIGLALLMRQNPAFDGIADIVISVIIGATVVHELFGPILSKAAIGAAGEIPADRRGP